MNRSDSVPIIKIAAQDTRLAMLSTLTLVSGIFVFVVELTYRITQSVIVKNKCQAIQGALFKVIPEAVTRHDFIFDGEHLVLVDNNARGSSFADNFNHMDALFDYTYTGLVNDIVMVKHGSKSDPWKNETITGATISLRAVGKMLNKDTQLMRPLLKANNEQQQNSKGDLL